MFKRILQTSKEEWEGMPKELIRGLSVVIIEGISEGILAEIPIRLLEKKILEELFEEPLLVDSLTKFLVNVVKQLPG